MRTNSMILLMVIGVAAALSTSMAFAHPSLIRSNPIAGAKVKAPEQVSLWFSETVEPVFNRIEIVDRAGTHFEEGRPMVDASDKTHLHVRIKHLPIGFYHVRWRVSAADSHKMEGSFSFQVEP